MAGNGGGGCALDSRPVGRRTPQSSCPAPEFPGQSWTETRFLPARCCGPSLHDTRSASASPGVTGGRATATSSHAGLWQSSEHHRAGGPWVLSRVETKFELQRVVPAAPRASARCWQRFRGWRSSLCPQLQRLAQLHTVEGHAASCCKNERRDEHKEQA